MTDKHTDEYLRGYCAAMAEVARESKKIIKVVRPEFSLREFVDAGAERRDVKALANAGMGRFAPTNKGNRGIGDLIRHLLAQGKETDEVIRTARKKFPTAPVTSSYVADYRRKMVLRPHAET